MRGKTPDADGRSGLRSAVRCADAAYWASWADAPIWLCGPWTVACQTLGVWPSSNRRLIVWTRRGSGGGQAGLRCVTGNDPQRSQPGTLASGFTVGHLPFPTPISRSALCCQAVLLLTEPI